VTVAVVSLSILALCLLGALIHLCSTQASERQEILSTASAERESLRAEHAAERDSLRAEHQAERADLLDRLHTTAADQVAAVVRSIPPPAKPEPAVDEFVFALDDDLRLLEPTD
jgi:type II secretory pathway component PulJ